MSFRTLLLGDVVGKPGRQGLEGLLQEIVDGEHIDLVIVNGENVAGGSGITPSIYHSFRALGIDVITMGDHCFRKKESIPLYESQDRLLRPANLPDVAVGRGWVIVESRTGIPAAVICLQGRTFMKPIDCPFRAVERALEEIGDKTKLIFIDMHAEATSDKMAMGWHLDGRITALVGTHTHIQTADEQLLHHGTAYISDLGMTGPYDSVLGRDKKRVIRAVTTGMPTFFEVATGNIKVCGVIVTADATTGRATNIRRLMAPFSPSAATESYDSTDGKGEGGMEDM